jgi:hypothetical protein
VRLVLTDATKGNVDVMRRDVLAAGVAATIALLAVSSFAQSPSNPRYGRWKLKSDAPAPTSNIMTYEPYKGKGMTITIDAVSKDGVATKWGYNTMFDGKDEPLYGNPATDTGSVRIINDRINEIIYKKGGKVTQVLTNVLSPDGDTIGIIYMRMDPEGKSTRNVTFATYEKIK